MVFSNNVLVFLFALVPIVLYATLLHMMIPRTYVNLHRSRRYMISGLMSPFIIFLVYFIFPDWGKRIEGFGIYGLVFFTVIQVGFIEELCKYMVFKWVTSERISSKNDLPIATMFYALMTSLGFALTENFSYLISYNESLSDNPLFTETNIRNKLFTLTATRSITAVVIHMICGVIIGYFISKSILKTKMSFEANLCENTFEWKFPKKTYLVFGIMFSSLYHGIYNANLMLLDNNYKAFFSLVIMGFGLAIGYFMITDLIRESKFIRQCKLN